MSVRHHCLPSTKAVMWSGAHSTAQLCHCGRVDLHLAVELGVAAAVVQEHVGGLAGVVGHLHEVDLAADRPVLRVGPEQQQRVVGAVAGGSLDPALPAAVLLAVAPGHARGVALRVTGDGQDAVLDAHRVGRAPALAAVTRAVVDAPRLVEAAVEVLDPVGLAPAELRRGTRRVARGLVRIAGFGGARFGARRVGWALPRGRPTPWAERWVRCSAGPRPARSPSGHRRPGWRRGPGPGRCRGRLRPGPRLPVAPWARRSPARRRTWGCDAGVGATAGAAGAESGEAAARTARTVTAGAWTVSASAARTTASAERSTAEAETARPDGESVRPWCDDVASAVAEFSSSVVRATRSSAGPAGAGASGAPIGAAGATPPGCSELAAATGAPTSGPGTAGTAGLPATGAAGSAAAAAARLPPKPRAAAAVGGHGRTAAGRRSGRARGRSARHRRGGRHRPGAGHRRCRHRRSPRLRGPGTGGRVHGDRHRRYRTGRRGTRGGGAAGSGRAPGVGPLDAPGPQARRAPGAPLGRRAAAPARSGAPLGSRVLRPGLGRGHTAGRCGEREATCSRLGSGRDRTRQHGRDDDPPDRHDSPHHALLPLVSHGLAGGTVGRFRHTDQQKTPHRV